MRKMPKKYSHEYVYNYFKEHGCELLEEYKDARTPMKYICQCGNKSKISFDNFKKGKRCKKCGINKLVKQFKHDYNYIKKCFEERGCILLSREYKNGHTPLDYICSCGNKSKITFFDLLEGKRCWECGRKKLADYHRLDYDYVYKFFKDHGCELLEKEYINAHQKLKYRCECGEISEITFDKFKMGQRCEKCKIKKISGENHYNYNPNLTDEEREIKRNYPEYREWAKRVKERDNYTCQRCGQVGYKLVSHHIESYKDNPELRTDINNGITLCKWCHISFHSKYGYKNITKQQFEKFMTGVSWDYKTKLLQNV